MDPHHNQREDADYTKSASAEEPGAWTSGSSASQVSTEQADANNVLRQCVFSLLQDTNKAGVVRELISASLTSTTSESIESANASAASSFSSSSSNMLLRLANASAFSTTNQTSSSLNSSSNSSSLYGATSSNFMHLDDFDDLELANMGRANPSSRLDLHKLGKLLPATESLYQLEALSERWQICLVIIYSLTAIASFLLNVITVIVLYRGQRSELRKYLMNLSLSDLLMSLFSILTLSVFVSVATMTVIGINRYVAIMYPLKGKRRSKVRHWAIRKTHVIVGIWLLGIAISLPEYLMFSAEPFCYNKQLYYECRCSWLESISNSYTVFIYLSTFIIPLAILTYLYTCICFKLWHRQMPGNVDVNRDLTMQTKRAKVVKMLLMVVIFFAAFWLPLQTFSMVMFLYPEIRAGFVYQSLAYNIFIGTYFACHWLSMAHSCLNSLIYCFMNEKFRDDLHNLICCLRGQSLAGAAAGAASRLSKGHLSGSYSTSIMRMRTYSLTSHKTQSVQDLREQLQLQPQQEQQQQTEQQQPSQQATFRPTSNSVRIKFKLDCECRDQVATCAGNSNNGHLIADRGESSDKRRHHDERVNNVARESGQTECGGNQSFRSANWKQKLLLGRQGSREKGVPPSAEHQHGSNQRANDKGCCCNNQAKFRGVLKVDKQQRRRNCRRRDSTCPIERFTFTRAVGSLVGCKHRQGTRKLRGEDRDVIDEEEEDYIHGIGETSACLPMDKSIATNKTASSTTSFTITVGSSSTTEANLPCDRFYKMYDTCNNVASGNSSSSSSDKLIATNDSETVSELSGGGGGQNEIERPTVAGAPKRTG